MKPKTDPCEKIKCKPLVIEGTRYRTTYTRKFENRKPWAPPNPNHINAFIPGNIVKIHVKEGQKVAEGQDLLVLEAMKMKNQLKAPFDAVIKSVKVKEGEKVAKDVLLIELG